MKSVTVIKGGKRPGAGRKPGEPTVVIRVPASLADEVRALIRRRKETPLSSATAISEVTPESCSGSDRGGAVADPEQKPLGPDIKTIRNALERLPRDRQRLIRQQYGTLSNAVRAGVRVENGQVIGI